MGCDSSKPQVIVPTKGCVKDVGSGHKANGLHSESTCSQRADGSFVYEDGVREATVRERPKTALPEGEFEGGNLGLTNNEAVQQELDRLSPGRLFEDSEFVADVGALCYRREDAPRDVQWMRPSELDSAPQLVVDGTSKNDIQQGELGDCWFLSSCAVIAQEPRFMNKIVPSAQSLSGADHRGLVHFRFWRFGDWVDVYVDDLLPTRGGRLIYAHSDDQHEFWVPLVEKAYAKLHGSYQAIEGGQTMDALVDLTGGLAERYDMNGTPDVTLFAHLHRAAHTGAFIACSKKGDWQQSAAADARTGLVSGHAYSITLVKKVNTRSGVVELLRVRNPWGNGMEWTGRWSDGHALWNDVDEATKQSLHFTAQEDGEFWMCYQDFVTHFQEVTICTTGPDFDGDGQTDIPGHVKKVHGQWVRGRTAGGCRNDLASFATNPQFILSLTEPDDDDDEEVSTSGRCSVVLTLMQEHRRSQRHKGVKQLQIGFCLYKVSEADGRLPADHFARHRDSGTSGVFINYREVAKRFVLEPGHYVVIPSTFNVGEQSTFLMRAFAMKHFELSALPE